MVGGLDTVRLGWPSPEVCLLLTKRRWRHGALASAFACAVEAFRFFLFGSLSSAALFLCLRISPKGKREGVSAGDTSAGALLMCLFLLCSSVSIRWITFFSLFFFFLLFDCVAQHSVWQSAGPRPESFKRDSRISGGVKVSSRKDDATVAINSPADSFDGV